MIDDKVKIKCSNCANVFRERVQSIRDGRQMQCPYCLKLLSFDNSSEDRNIRRALKSAKEVRVAIEASSPKLGSHNHGGRDLTADQVNGILALMNSRRNERYQVLQAGTISLQGRSIDCAVHDLSVGGANLEVDSQIGIPDSFDLLVADIGKQRVASFDAERDGSVLRSLTCMFTAATSDVNPNS